MRRVRRSGVSEVLSRDWLTRVGARPDHALAVTEDVHDRLGSLPTALRVAVGVADTALGTLPEPLARRVCALPGIGEYARIVESLTAVSYFDVVTREAPAAGLLPSQRRAEAVPMTVERTVPAAEPLA